MVPKNWGKSALGELFEFKNGLNADKSQYGTGLKFVNVMDVLGHDALTNERIKGRVEVQPSDLEANLLRYGDVLFNRTSETFDQIAESAVYLDDQPAVFGGFVIRARAVTTKVEPSFSIHAFQCSHFRRQVIRLGQGAVRANIGQKDLAKVVVLVPPRAEQLKISQILSAWDKAIATTEKLLANSQQQKKALMQQLLTGKKRLRDSSGDIFRAGWSSIKVKDLFGKTSETAGTQYYPTYSVTKTGLVRQDEYFNKSVASDDVSKYKVVRKGNFVMSGLNFWMGSVDVHTDSCPVKVSPAYKVFTINEEFAPDFVKHFVGSQPFRRVLVGSSLVGASVVRRNFSESIFRNWELKIPSLDEQIAIARALGVADQDYHALERYLFSLKAEKKALMQQLLTGKRRVKTGEVAA